MTTLAIEGGPAITLPDPNPATIPVSGRLAAVVAWLVTQGSTIVAEDNAALTLSWGQGEGFAFDQHRKGRVG